MVLARAVRKAVISSALIKALGFPDLSNSVRLPFGVVLWALATDCWGSIAVVDELADLSDSERASTEEDTDLVSEAFL